jgi:hypothetical protein
LGRFRFHRGIVVASTFPVEFIVKGTPVSFQNPRPEARNEWKARVNEACSARLPPGYTLSAARIAVTLYYFPIAPMQGDVDNIVKLVLDAMCGQIYVDDSQIDRIVVQRFEPGNYFGFASPSPILEDALEQAEPVLYVRLSEDPLEDLK